MMSHHSTDYRVIYVPKLDELVIVEFHPFGFVKMVRSIGDFTTCEYDSIDTRKFFQKYKTAFVVHEWSGE